MHGKTAKASNWAGVSDLNVAGGCIGDTASPRFVGENPCLGHAKCDFGTLAKCSHEFGAVRTYLEMRLAKFQCLPASMIVELAPG